VVRRETTNSAARFSNVDLPTIVILAKALEVPAERLFDHIP
jgi:hypothetical protein